MSALQSVLTQVYLSMLLLGLSRPMAAQNDYQPWAASAPNGHWQLNTDPAERVTRVRFYNRAGELIYEEWLTGKYLKLTPRNIKVLDACLAGLAGNQLVAREARASAIDRPHPFADPVSSNTLRQFQPMNASGSLSGQIRYNLIPKPDQEALMIGIDNPAAETLRIRLIDPQGNVLCQEKTRQERYRSLLRIGKLESGTYTVTVSGGEHQFSQGLSLLRGQKKLIIQLLPGE
jgi:hypothetical protein